MVAVRGFGGLSLEQDGIHVQPILPEDWTGIEYPLSYLGNRFRIYAGKDHITATAAPDNRRAASLFLGGQCHWLSPGEQVTVRYQEVLS